MRRGALRPLLVYLAALALATLVLAEVGLRILIRTNPENGTPMLGATPLVPFRPAPDAVRAWLARGDEATYVVRDPALGWTVARGGHMPGGRYEANAQGARAPASRSYAPAPPPGVFRILTVGDSFTHGDQVAFADTWQQELERLRGDLEVVNFGVGGYGTDQAVLRWERDGSALRADLVVLGIWPENIARNLSVVRYFLQPAGGFLAKPRFVLEDGTLALVNSPVLAGEALVEALSAPERAPALAHDFWARPGSLTPRPWHRLRLARVVATLVELQQRRALRQRLYTGEVPEGIALTVAIAERFRDAVERSGARPVVVLIPMRELLDLHAEEGGFPLVAALRAQGLDVVDLGPPMARAVREAGIGCCYLADGHLSPEGNRRVAAWLAEELPGRLGR